MDDKARAAAHYQALLAEANAMSKHELEALKAARREHILASTSQRAYGPSFDDGWKAGILYAASLRDAEAKS